MPINLVRFKTLPALEHNYMKPCTNCHGIIRHTLHSDIRYTAEPALHLLLYYERGVRICSFRTRRFSPDSSRQDTKHKITQSAAHYAIRWASPLTCVL
jgi:hypothetical protein